MFTSGTTSDYSSSIGISQLAMEIATAKWKYNTNNNHAEVAPNCPRCASSNTKFCYYNNYSLSQPRYFCKGCRRYWTKGGSLRNVPVGGGCRKSRRSRAAVRQGGGTANYAAPTLGRVGSADDSNGSAFIDMAAVFAKYVGQNEESFSPGASSGSSDNVQASSLDVDGQVEDVRMFEYQQPLDLIYGGDDQIQQVIPQLSMCQDITGQDLVYQESHALGLHQGVLGDELAADMLWSEGTTLPDFGLDQQPMVQVQNCGPDTSDHQLRISSNLVTDNWGSFDLCAAYEFYSAT